MPRITPVSPTKKMGTSSSWLLCGLRLPRPKWSRSSASIRSPSLCQRSPVHPLSARNCLVQQPLAALCNVRVTPQWSAVLDQRILFGPKPDIASGSSSVDASDRHKEAGSRSR